ncbi:MAG: hypothetical protein RR351_02780, partial [Christensenella sp.]
ATLFITKTVYAVLLALLTLILVESSYPFSPIQMTLISFVTIGYPAFFLALEPNFAPVKQNFLINILKKSLPGGLSVILGIIAINILAGIYQYTPSAMSTMCLLIAVAAGIWVVAKVSKPFTTLRKVIFGTTILAFVLCIVFARGFFDVAPISLPQAVVVCIFTVVAPFLMRAFEKAVEKWADKILAKKLFKNGIKFVDGKKKD